MKDVRALQVIPAELVKPFKSNFPSRLAQSRAELLEKLLAELGVENSGFTLDNVMTVKDLHTFVYVGALYYLMCFIKSLIRKPVGCDYSYVCSPVFSLLQVYSVVCLGNND